MNALLEAEREGVIEYTRQRDWLDPTKLDPMTARVMLFGAGGVGSIVAVALTKLGLPRIDVIDPDTVEAHNLPNQFFGVDHLGFSKVEAAEATCSQLGVPEMRTFRSKLTEDGWEGDDVPPLGGIVIASPDNMDARKLIWEQVKRNIRVSMFIDVRLGGENIVLYCVNSMDSEAIEGYEGTLYEDGEALPDPCTRRSVIDVGFSAASLVTRAVRRKLAGEEIEAITFLNQEALNIHKGVWQKL